MLKTLGSTLVLGWLLGLVGVAHAQTDPHAIVGKALKALGEADKAASAKAVTWKTKGTFYGTGAGVPYSGEWTVQWPDQSKAVIDSDFNGMKISFVVVVNKNKGWRKVNDMTMEMEKDQIDEQKEEMFGNWLSTVFPLKNSKQFTLTSVGDAKVDNHSALGVKVSCVGHRDVTLYFDKDSGLLLKSEKKIKDESGAEMKQEQFYSDYKDIDGVKHPMKVIIKRDGNVYIEGENSDFKIVDKLDDKTFAEP